MNTRYKLIKIYKGITHNYFKFKDINGKIIEITHYKENNTYTVYEIFQASYNGKYFTEPLYINIRGKKNLLKKLFKYNMLLHDTNIL